ncbi:benzoylformate decarboxylase [Kineosphaera limosa]|uniref:Putative decarboxylase n=1 Tax=Kineosphaera limosa NBRC 100340 TaxID=1184609 RepID=K6VP22_9MICO|nr:thiamine pyrophosphate-binding protein [Kineosphaera limosa]NYE02632.1 benzoylformate decarboxylase [Kineosphaera limosa]GAB97958.1 putative decarboxylase [Kineosphaera limosa NBRC 100340]
MSKEVRTGREAIIEQLLADGIDHMFGNPGTVEQGFLDAMSDYPDMKYILTLQESVAVLCADGYARATQRPALVQLHSAPGIGNAVGALYQAKRGHSPLVVIAGDAGLKYMNLEAQMSADLVAIMAPVTKYATMVLHPDNLLRTLRRAIKVAITPPMGPVYVCLPADVLDEPNTETVVPTSIPYTRVAPAQDLIDQAAATLLKGAKPRIYVGDGVATSGAVSQVARVAELLGAQVFGVDTGDVVMDTTHPCYGGTTGHMFGEQSLPILRGADANLVVGTYLLPEVFPDLGDIFDPSASVVHFDLDAHAIAKNHRVDLGIVCDPAQSLDALAAALAAQMTDEDRRQAQQRLAELEEAARAGGSANDQPADDGDPKAIPQMATFARALAQHPRSDRIIVFDEALTNSPPLAE